MDQNRHSDPEQVVLSESYGQGTQKLVGTSSPVIDVLGNEHPSIRAMLDYWSQKQGSNSNLESPPYFLLSPNPIATSIAGSKRDKSIKSVDPSETIIMGDKQSSIYKLFSYHTKFPPDTARNFIETYSEPGQIVLDPFCGSGMLGLGAHYRLDNNQHRKVILSDLSPAAAHLAWAYNSRPRKDILEAERKRINRILASKLGELYGSSSSGKTWIYQVWSDIVKCPSCNNDFPFIEVEKPEGKDSCPNCSEPHSWKSWKRMKETLFDPILASDREIVRQKLCHTWYKKKAGAKRVPHDNIDNELEEECDRLATKMLKDLHIPITELPEGVNLNQPKKSHGLTHVHHFYTLRSLAVLGAIHEEVERSRIEVRHVLRQAVLSLHTRGSIRNRYLQEYGHRHVGIQSGTLYVPPVREEVNLIDSFDRRIKKIINTIGVENPSSYPVIVGVQSATALEQIPDDSVDYVLTDPPFGSNINYSDLNFLSEAWLDSFTDISQEAIINKTQNKALNVYGDLMRDSFKEMYRVLRPSAFLTVIFQNSDNDVWNEIQSGLVEVGFETYDVVVIDKGKSTIKAAISDNATSQDIAITMRKSRAYDKNPSIASGEDNFWHFLDEMISNSPQGMPARDESSRQLNPVHMQALYSQMVMFHLSRNLRVPFTVVEFLESLEKRYVIKNQLCIALHTPSILDIRSERSD